MAAVKDAINMLIGRKPQGPKIRYGVIGAGWISQGSFMPGVSQTSNSVLTVLVSSDPEKREKLGKLYNLTTYAYDQFPQALAEGHCDAFYIATPNNQHRKFAVPALEQGYHVLLEKPMEVSVEDCEAIIAAQKKSGAKLMIALRLHHEPGSLDIIERVRNGDIGNPRIFSSVFCYSPPADNHRAQQGFDTGPVPDIGLYPINAARNIFGVEPIEVTAIGFKTPGYEFFKMDHDAVSVTLRFPGESVAQFTVSFASAGAEGYRIIGTKGDIDVRPAFLFGPGVKITYRARIGEKEDSKTFPEVDHFGGQAEYFSDCILNNVDPEADGEEGLLDVRVITAIKKSLENHGNPIKLEPYQRSKRPTLAQAKELPLAKGPESLVGRDMQRPEQ